MKKNPLIFALIFIALASFQLGMARNNNQYDEEARQAEREAKAMAKAEKKVRKNAAQNFVEGIKEVAYDSPSDIISSTTQSAMQKNPLDGTVEGLNEGTEGALDKTVRGASKIATLGIGEVENYEVQEPEKGSGDTTKIRIKIPGT